MAAPLQALRRLLRFSGNPTPTLSRSAFTATKDDTRNPNWIKVGITLGSTIAIWVLLLKQHYEDTREYERRKAETERLRAETERLKAEREHLSRCPKNG